ncbi:MAG: hypothetical protein V4487_03575 [Chlamydiota bacterium]
MQKNSLPDSEERIFTLSDVRRLFFGQWRRLIRIGLIGGLCILSFAALRTSKYKVEATFKEGQENSGRGANTLNDLLGGINGSAQLPQASALMKSYRVLKPLVCKMGLQATISDPSWIPTKILKRFRENIRAELEKSLEDLDPFLFQDLSYEGEDKIVFFLRFKDAEHYTLLSPNRKTEIAHAKIGSPISFSGGGFTLIKTPKALKFETPYRLVIAPWLATAKKIRESLQIVSHKTNKSIYDLTFYHRNRHLGMRLVNGLMEEYQRYLKQDHDQLANEQLIYLESKQTQLYGTMGTMLDEHVAYLKNNLGIHGFIGLKEESEALLKPHQEMLFKTVSIDVELARLEQIEKLDPATPLFQEQYFSTGLGEIHSTIRGLRLQRDLLELSLNPQQHFAGIENPMDIRRDELKEIRSQQQSIHQLIETLSPASQIPLSSFNIDQTLSFWVEKIQQSQDPEEREDLTEYLENCARLLSVRENMLQERFFYPQEVPSELEGIDLPMTKSLFTEYNAKLDKHNGALCYYKQLKEEMLRPDFDLGSLSPVLGDAVSSRLIERAIEIVFRLKEEKYHSSKEGQRWEEELVLQRKILGDHLENLLRVEELNGRLLREKILGLQRISLDCMNRQISALHAQARDTIRQKREALILEKMLLQKKMEEIRERAVELPEKWRLEKWLDLKSEMGQKMMETVTQLVESKTIGHHLHHVESKPLDLATLPVLPQPPHLFILLFLGAFSASFGAFFVSLIRSILKGFPTSLEKLQAMGWPILGTVSSFCDGPAVDAVTGPDLQMLRKLALFIQERRDGKIIGLIGGKGPDYSYALGENLGRMSLKTIVLRCDFAAVQSPSDLPGLLQVWKGTESQLPIRRAKGFDYLTTGGYSLFGTELIQSPQFGQLLDAFRKNYDRIFLLFRSPLSSAESVSALRLCDQAVVTVQGEQIEELTPFIDWAYHEGSCRLMFVASDCL